MWDRLAIEAEHCNKTNARLLYSITPEPPRNGRWTRLEYCGQI